VSARGDAVDASSARARNLCKQPTTIVEHDPNEENGAARCHDPHR
jgi:hypothetical protein